MLQYFTFAENAKIPSYNFFVGLGIALAMLYLQYNHWFKQRTQKEQHNIHVSLLLATLIGFAGAFAFDAYTQNLPINFENLNRIGLTFFSGLLSGLTLLVLFLHIFKLPIIAALDNLVESFCIAHIIGRIGCFFAGCCYGSPTNSILGVTFPEGSLPHSHHLHEKLHPTQLYESFFILVIFLFIRIKRPKDPFFIYLLSYSVFRFFLEFIRSDNRGTALEQSVFTPSQLISLITFIVAGLFAYLYYCFKKSSLRGSNRY